jgi:hypothetical protein
MFRNLIKTFLSLNECHVPFPDLCFEMNKVESKRTAAPAITTATGILVNIIITVNLKHV